MKDAIEQRLAQLEPPTRGGQTRAIRERYDAIEQALQRGVTRQQVVEALGEEGVKVSLPFFKNILHRIRQEKKRVGIPAAPTPPGKAQTPPEAAEPSALASKAQMDTWQRIDKIRNSSPDLPALRKQHLSRVKGKKE